MKTIELRTHYYEQFNADFSLDVPAEGYGGWKSAMLPLSLDHTAVVVMHAWDCGTQQAYPGWHRAVEYIPRADAICRTVFPNLLAAVRKSRVHLFHVVGGGAYYQDLPGYAKAKRLAKPECPEPEQIAPDPVWERLRSFPYGPNQYGEANRTDIGRGFRRIDFPAEARPAHGEGVAENADQLFALCKEAGVNHLIYAGFAIDWCLLVSGGGMVDMMRRGFLCSALRQAVTAVENKETARKELCKEIGLWRVARMFGFVYDADDFVKAIGIGES